jgi:anti-sigma regulatory factor (Ser/Thr protein kinase)
MKTEIQCRFVASLSKVDWLCSELRERVLSEIPKCERFIAELLLREALTNAVRHGTAAPGGEVWCEIELLEGGIAMRIGDAGEGFDWRRQLGAEAPPLAESGRGIQILRHYSSSLRFNQKGNCVEVIRMFNQGEHDGEF